MTVPLSNDLGLLAEQSLRARQDGAQSAVRRSRGLLDALRAGNRGSDPASTRKALRDASQEFEAVFMNQLVSAMRKTVGDGGLIKKGQGEKVFESMLDEEWARNLSGRHGAGSLSQMIYQQLSRQMGLPADGAPEAALHPMSAGLSPDPAADSQTVRSDALPGAAADHPLLRFPAAAPPAGLLTAPPGERDR